MAVSMAEEGDPASSGSQGSVPDIMVLWSLVTELSEQLTRNRALAGTLRSQLTDLNTSAIHAKTGFALRRFNTHLTPARFEEELSAMNIAMSRENGGLQHENKQLGLLIREYEQTLESVMAAFRTQAHDVQERELATIRTFEGTLLEQESAALMLQLDASAVISNSFSNMSRSLRALLRTAVNGEDALIFAQVQPDAVPPLYSHMEERPPSVFRDTPHASFFSSDTASTLEGPVPETSSSANPPGAVTNGDSLSELAVVNSSVVPSAQLAFSTSDDVEVFRHGRADDAEAACADWALERETELARLEAENAELRDLLSLHRSLEGLEGEKMLEKARASWSLKLPNRPIPGREGRVGALGGKAGTVGPFGRYKYGMDNPGHGHGYGYDSYDYGYGGEHLRSEESMMHG